MTTLSRHLEQLGFRDTCDRVSGQHGEGAEGDGAGLVEHDRVHLTDPLQEAGPLDQDAPARRNGQGCDHGHGSRQNQGAWAGDDQHCDGALHLAGDKQHNSRNDEDEWQVGRVFADALHLELQQTIEVGGAGEDRAAGHDILWEALTGDGGLVDARVALHDHCVCRDGLSRSNEDDVPNLQGLRTNCAFLPVHEQGGTPRLQLLDPVDGGACPHDRAFFQKVACLHQERDHGGRHEVTDDGGGQNGERDQLFGVAARIFGDEAFGSLLEHLPGDDDDSDTLDGFANAGLVWLKRAPCPADGEQAGTHQQLNQLLGMLKLVFFVQNGQLRSSKGGGWSLGLEGR